jgi:hypothetical protein
MTCTPGPEPIVVGVNGSPGSDRAVGWAANEASRRHLPLDRGDSSAELIGALLPAFELESVDVPQAAADPARTVDANLRITNRSERIGSGAAYVSSPLSADTVVLGSRGVGAVGRMLAGPTSVQLEAHALTPGGRGPRDPGRSGEDRACRRRDRRFPRSLDTRAYAVSGGPAKQRPNRCALLGHRADRANTGP